MASQKKSKNRSSPEAGNLGEFLRRLRLERDLPLREVAAAAGMDQAHLSKAELGQRMPTPDQTAVLARFFKQDLVELEAHRIADKFRRKHAGNPAAARALAILHGRQVATLVPASPTPKTTPPVVPDEPAPDRSVIVLHAD